MPARIPIDHERIAAFCRKWQITEFALFGSVLRDDFRPDSDVDVLVSFAPETHWSLMKIVEIEAELKTIFGREVDLVDRKWAEESESPSRKRHILSFLEEVNVA